MTPHSAATTIEHINSMWRVCTNGICKEHRQEWQAKVYLHQMQQARYNEAPPTIAS